MKNITIVSGARPNFVKIAPIVHSLQKVVASGAVISYRIVHTGQHYDYMMSDSFFSELNIPAPNVNLGCGGGSQAQQTAAIMVEFEKELFAHPAECVLVVGDVTSTLACSIVAKKAGAKVAHIEAGLRSFDATMPEEINRVVTDAIADYYFTTSEFANANLKRIGVGDERIFFVGNVMIDTLLAHINNLRPGADYAHLCLQPHKYIVLTLHRPSNVDEEKKLMEVIAQIVKSSNGVPVVFPVHPRTATKLTKLNSLFDNLFLIPPQGYLEFNYLVKNAMAVITDSGGVTEEATVMQIPCLTLRNNTERPETCLVGTNELVGSVPSKIALAMNKLFSGSWKEGAIPALWDGKAADRIVDVLLKL